MEKVIYVDMDGVLSNFEKRYEEVFHMSSARARDLKHMGKEKNNWLTFVSNELFETLPPMPRFKELFDFLQGLPVRKMILSSTGGAQFHGHVLKQKLTWLKNNQVPWGPIFVPGRRYKKTFAGPSTLLIDDTIDVVTSFRGANGSAILHNEEFFDRTISDVEEWMTRGQKTYT